MPLFSPAPNPASPLGLIREDYAGVRVPDVEAAWACYGEKLDVRLMDSTEQGSLTFALLAPAAELGRRLALFDDPWGNVFELTQPMTA